MDEFEIRSVNRINLVAALERWFGEKERERLTRIQLYRGPYGSKGTPEQSWDKEQLDGHDADGFLEELFPAERLAEPQRWTVATYLSRDGQEDQRELRHVNVVKRTRPEKEKVDPGPVNAALGSLLEKQTGAIAGQARDVSKALLEVVDRRLEEASEAYEQRRDIEDSYGVDLREIEGANHQLELKMLEMRLTGGFWTPELRNGMIERGFALADRVMAMLGASMERQGQDRGSRVDSVRLLALQERLSAQEEQMATLIGLVQEQAAVQAAQGARLLAVLERLAPAPAAPG